MARPLILLFLAIPLLVVAGGFLSVRWPGWTARIPWLRVAQGGGWAIGLALVVGEVRNGFWKAPGFHGGLWALGAAAWVLALVAAHSRSVRSWGNDWIRRIWSSLREDLGDPGEPNHPRRSRLLPGLALLSWLALFYLASMTFFRFNYQWIDFTQEYLDQIRQAARQASWWDLVLRRTPGSTVLYNPFTFLVFPFVEHLDCWTYLQVRLA